MTHAHPPTLAAWLHDLSPWVLRFGQSDLGVRWYGLSYILGFLAAWLIVRWMARRRMTPIPEAAATDVILWTALGAIVGGRLFYCLVYQPSLLVTFEPSFPYWGGLMINRGGMASHGGIIGVCVACWRISRGFRTESGELIGRAPPVHVMEVLAAAVGPGLLFGRLANFVNGELLGRVAAAPGEPAPGWAVRFPQEHLTEHAPALTPAQEGALIDIARTYAPNATRFADAYERVLERLQAGGPDAAAIAERLAPLVSARHPSQLYQALAEGVIPTLVVWWLWRKPRAVGVVGGAWLMTYGALRVATEFVRLPDDHLTVARLAGLTRGQWLSVLMVLVGLGVMLLARRWAKGAFGGWARAGRNQPASEGV